MNISKVPRRYWTAPEIALLTALYPDTQTDDLARCLNRSTIQVSNKASTLGLKKSVAYLASSLACRLHRGDEVGKAFRFSPGHAPWNKGLKGWVAPGTEATRFQPGNRPHSWLPLGSERVNDGYLQRKTTDTGYAPRDWVGVQVLLWIETHGPVPAGHVVAFKDGDKGHIVIENLELVSRAEMCRRNSYHNWPKPLARLVQLKGVLNRKINERRKAEQA